MPGANYKLAPHQGRGHKQKHQWQRNISRMERELAALPSGQAEVRQQLRAKIENSKRGLAQLEVKLAAWRERNPERAVWIDPRDTRLNNR